MNKIENTEKKLLESIYEEFEFMNFNMQKINEQLVIQNKILEMLVKVQAEDLNFKVIKE